MVVMVIAMFVCSGGVWIRMSGGLGQVVQVRVSLGETVLWELARYVARACVRAAENGALWTVGNVARCARVISI